MTTPSVPLRAAPVRPSREGYADNLKVLLVAGVIVGHLTIGYTGLGAWTLSEPSPMLP